jgi:Leucine-rich repeat (LRR) protein
VLPTLNGFTVQELSSLVMLMQLVLDHNLLRHLPPVVLSLPALAVLMASSNSITYLPDGLGQMQQLQALLMHSNQLMQVR